MSMSSWEPHGLIQHPLMECLYLSARVTVAEGGYIWEPGEESTMALFMQLFQCVVFNSMAYNLLPQAPPATGSNLKSDLTIRHAITASAYQPVCFVEARGANSQESFQINDIESKALSHCKAFLNANQDCEVIYAMTLVGTCVRCWRFDRSLEVMQGLWAGLQNGDYHDYLDIGLDQNRNALKNAFDRMKADWP